MEFRTLLFERRESLAYVTVNRPEKLNALNQIVLDELSDCFGVIQRDGQIRAAILSGAGEKAFVAGADVSEIAALTSLGAREISLRAQAVFDFIENLGTPVIAAVRGYALGGGCELAMACTLRVASESSRFGQPEVKLGIIPGYGGTQRLSRLIGKGRAMEMILTGEMVTAQEAYRIGLVNSVVPETDVITAAESIARKIVANAPLAVKFSMDAVNHGVEMTQREGEFLEATLFGLCCATEDMKEGTRAFLEKRPPKFIGK
ncbi:MAG TPA: enoyl-CoA hydratase-related protein [Terriglobia bacterium]|nr:enoyl-CoA hydratase-related protein [Terriglobia bacterium]